jgi:hypothetical protein
MKLCRSTPINRAIKWLREFGAESRGVDLATVPTALVPTLLQRRPALLRLNYILDDAKPRS